MIDLNFDSPEIAPLLDIDPSRGLFDLAYNAQLAPVEEDELEQHLGWRDGIAVLPGIVRRDNVERISDHFITGLLQTAGRRFDHVIIDLGRLRSGPLEAAATGQLLWVVTPAPLGMDALERQYWSVEEQGQDWLQRTSLVLNRTSEQSFVGVERYAASEYDLLTAGRIPDAPDFWRGVERLHSPRALNSPGTDDPRYRKHYGEQALSVRRALEALADWLVPIELAASATSV
ncbi:MAG: hypothetical protein ACREOY_14305 [Candidatus Dormibacteraceae bacterium]